MTAEKRCACGQAIGTSPFASACGNCREKDLQAAKEGGHAYRRTHVHVAADGTRTIELGTSCECGERETA